MKIDRIIEVMKIDRIKKKRLCLGIQKLHRPDDCAQTRQGVDINVCAQVLKTPESKMDKTKTKLEMH